MVKHYDKETRQRMRSEQLPKAQTILKILKQKEIDFTSLLMISACLGQETAKLGLGLSSSSSNSCAFLHLETICRMFVNDDRFFSFEAIGE